jgi:hypothetical protein
MNESKNETPWHLPWKEICEQCNEMRGTRYDKQKDLLKNLFNIFNKDIPKMANFLGVSVVSLREKLVREGIHKKKKYKERKIGELRKLIRDSPDDAFKNMTYKDLKEKFKGYNVNHITRLLRKEGKTYKKMWIWAKYDTNKYYMKGTQNG